MLAAFICVDVEACETVGQKRYFCVGARSVLGQMVTHDWG
jgi:hypothetical protein